MIRHEEWWLDPQNVLQGEFLYPKEHKELIFTEASNAGWALTQVKNVQRVSGLIQKRIYTSAY